MFDQAAHISLIENKECAAQLIDFGGMRFGSGFPTDVDGLIEWRNRCYIFYELKYKAAPMKEGQERAFVRLTDDMERIKPTLFVVAEHDVPLGQVIDLAACIVVKCRFRFKWWVEPVVGTTVRDLTARFLDRYGK